LARPGQRIEVGFASHRFKPRRFFVEHEFEAFHGRIHGLGELVQLGNIGFGMVTKRRLVIATAWSITACKGAAAAAG
jgi:hypothetical protein